MRIKTEVEIRLNAKSAKVEWLEQGTIWHVAELTFSEDPITYQVRILTQQYADSIEQNKLDTFTFDKVLTDDGGNPVDVLQYESTAPVLDCMSEDWCLTECLRLDVPFAVTNYELPKVIERLERIMNRAESMVLRLKEKGIETEADYTSLVLLDKLIKSLENE